MSAWLPSLGLVSSFPKHHGPYEVGTIDVEIPADELPAVSELPENAPPTIAFRLFYPCHKSSSRESDRPVRWLPQPQRLSLVALLSFLGLDERKSNVLSYIPQNLYYISLRAHRNAKIVEPPTSNKRWPVAFFSHGLAGSRNAYSYICGDVASNGMVVIAMDHRDGSSPVQYVRATSKTEAYTVPTQKIKHEGRDEVWKARDKQLRIRLWETSMAYEALKQIDGGEKVNNLDDNTSRKKEERIEVLQQFGGRMDIQRPGMVSWFGHSFGAATITQLLKSAYYTSERPAETGKPLIDPSPDAAILDQITPESPALLLDMWCLPLLSPEQKYLFDLPLPSYSHGGPNGNNILSVLSEGFAKWQWNLDTIKQIMAPPRQARSPAISERVARRIGNLQSSSARIRDESTSRDSGYASHDSASPAPPSIPPETREINDLRERESSKVQDGPYIFYVEKSQHFNQSDFGILFPWITRRFAKAEEPERILQLNTRAIVQVIRQAGVEVAGVSNSEILSTQEGRIRGWVAVPLKAESEMANGKAVEAVDHELTDMQVDFTDDREMRPV